LAPDDSESRSEVSPLDNGEQDPHPGRGGNHLVFWGIRGLRNGGCCHAGGTL